MAKLINRVVLEGPNCDFRADTGWVAKSNANSRKEILQRVAFLEFRYALSIATQMEVNEYTGTLRYRAPMMRRTTMRLAIVADDLTGAVDSAAAYRAFNPAANCLVIPWSSEPVQRWDQVLANHAPDLLCISTDSRNIHATTAANRVSLATSWALINGFRLMKKIDSLMRGNLTSELDAFMSEATTAGCSFLFAPALPNQGRVTAGGHQYHGSQLITESEAATDPLAAASNSELKFFISGERPIHPLDLEQVRDPSLAEHLQRLSTRGAVIIADAATEDDMVRLRRAALNLPQVALIGSSGILTGNPATSIVTAPLIFANLLIITASRRGEVRGQLTHFAEHVKNSRSIWIDPDNLPAASTISESIQTAFAEGNSCLVAIESTAILDPDLQQRRLQAAEIVNLLANCLQAVCANQNVPLLAVILGGDLAQACCANAGIEALSVQESSLKGGAASKVLGLEGFQDVSILMRSGGFGDADALSYLAVK